MCSGWSCQSVSHSVTQSSLSRLQRLHCEINSLTHFEENCVVICLSFLTRTRLSLILIVISFSVCEHQDSSIPLPAEIQHSEAPHNTHNSHQRQSTSTNIIGNQGPTSVRIPPGFFGDCKQMPPNNTYCNLSTREQTRVLDKIVLK